MRRRKGGFFLTTEQPLAATKYFTTKATKSTKKKEGKEAFSNYDSPLQSR